MNRKCRDWPNILMRRVGRKGRRTNQSMFLRSFLRLIKDSLINLRKRGSSANVRYVCLLILRGASTF